MPKTMTVPSSTTYLFQRCINCGVEFGVTDYFDDRRRADKQSFYCPNGHPQAYVKSEADRQRERADGLAAQVTHLRDQREAAERQLSATRGQVTKLRKRIANGVCPCCHRTFANVARHMAGQHPDYAA